MVEIGDAGHRLGPFGDLHFLADELADDLSVFRAVCECFIERFNLGDLGFALVDLGPQHFVDPQRFGGEDHEKRRGEEDSEDENDMAPVPGARGKVRGDASGDEQDQDANQDGQRRLLSAARKCARNGWKAGLMVQSR